MPLHKDTAGFAPAAVQDALERLGHNIKTARLRRRMPQGELARRMGVSRFVVADVEKGKPTTGITAYLGALWVMGLLGDLSVVADPDRDKEGKTLEQVRGPKTARKPRTLSDEF